MKRLKKNDGWCAPFALKYLSGLDDETVYSTCTFHGFDPSVGMEEFEYMDSAKDLGIDLKRMNLKKSGMYRAKLGQFIKYHPTGIYLIYTSRHVFVLDNGKIVDPLNPDHMGLRRLVTGAWRVL